MHKNVNLHDVSQQITKEEENDICERTQSNFIKSKAHLKYLIDAIDGIGNNNTKIDYTNNNGELHGKNSHNIIDAKVNNGLKD